MLFTEFRFLVFFALVFGVYWCLRDNRHRKWLLLLSSYLFYGAWDWRFLGLIIGSTLVDWLIGLRLGQEGTDRSRRTWIALSVVWNLGILAFFKYANFFIDSGVDLLSWLGLHPHRSTLSVILPVGISFFTFQSMSYSIDIYRRKLTPERSLLDFATFIAFFPQLFAGPIVRAIDFLPQLRAPRRLVDVAGRACVAMFIIGFIKKVCIADNLAPTVDAYFADPSAYDWSGAWIGILFYAAQIYCDFSGYTDMAIATAGLLGYEFCRNFDFPYFSTSIADFWRRWHMSLSSWLRDYLYIPLGGNRGGELFTWRNLMLTMVLGGLWHGAAWTFVVWGFLHGLALIAHRVWRQYAPTALTSRFPAAIGCLLTFWWVCLAWIFFRARSFDDALTAAGSFALFRSPGTLHFEPVCIAVFAALAVIHYGAYQRRLYGWWVRLPSAPFAAVAGVLFAFALPWMPLRYQPFIYFQF